MSPNRPADSGLQTHTHAKSKPDKNGTIFFAGSSFILPGLFFYWVRLCFFPGPFFVQLGWVLFQLALVFQPGQGFLSAVCVFVFNRVVFFSRVWFSKQWLWTRGGTGHARVAKFCARRLAVCACGVCWSMAGH